MQTRRFTDSYRNDNIAAGAIAGFLGGLCMAVITMIVSASAGLGFWHPVALASGIFYGVEAILGGAGPVITGLLVQMVSTTALGALFGSLLPRRENNSAKASGWGMLFGIACWAVTTFALLPLLNQTMKDRVDLAPGWWFFSFVAFGVVLGATPSLRRSVVRTVEEKEREEIRRAA